MEGAVDGITLQFLTGWKPTGAGLPQGGLAGDHQLAEGAILGPFPRLVEEGDHVRGGVVVEELPMDPPDLPIIHQGHAELPGGPMPPEDSPQDSLQAPAIWPQGLLPVGDRDVQAHGRLLPGRGAALGPSAPEAAPEPPRGWSRALRSDPPRLLGI